MENYLQFKILLAKQVSKKNKCNFNDLENLYPMNLSEKYLCEVFQQKRSKPRKKKT